MFEFLEKWDSALESFEKDIELSLKGEVRSWITHAQIYCERIFKLYNYKSYYFPISNKLTLGTFLGDEGFKNQFTHNTGFASFDSINTINKAANDIKHNGNNPEFSNSELNLYLKTIHTLSVKTYNYLEGNSISEKYDSKYFIDLINSNEKINDETAIYADSIIKSKDEIISELSDSLDVMGQFAREDREKLEKAEHSLSIYKDAYQITARLLEYFLDITTRFLDTRDHIGETNEEVVLNDTVSILLEKPRNISWAKYMKHISNTEKARNSRQRDAFNIGMAQRQSDPASFNIDDLDGSYYESSFQEPREYQ